MGLRFLSILIILYSAHVSAKDIQLSDINIEASSNTPPPYKQNPIGQRTLSRKQIEVAPRGNGNITDFLKGNPNVQFSNKSNQSTTQGEIDPQDISINGAQFWQNNFTLDGMNINNDLDPLSNKDYQGTIGVWRASGASTQGMAIDSDFLESISVHDSNVSAKYGGFNGGVIEAKTRNPRQGFHGKISFRHTRSEWLKTHIHKQHRESFANSFNAYRFQPRFKKYSGNLNLEGFLTEDLGVIFGYSIKRSVIPLKAYSESDIDRTYGDLEKERVQTREIQNYFLKTVYYASDRLTFIPTITYTPQKNKLFQYNAKDSYVYMKSGGLSIGAKIDYELDQGTITQNISYQRLESSREAEHKYRYVWKPSNLKPWGKSNSIEGGLGDIEQLQKSLTYGLDFSLQTINKDIEHDLAMGFEYKHSEATYDISQGFSSIARPEALKPGFICLPDDPFCLKDNSFGGKGQFLSRKVVYQGKNEAHINNMALYFEDTIPTKFLTFRAGARIEGDDYSKTINLAPRFSVSYDLFGNGDTILTTGANRYYGRNLFIYKLKDGRNNMMTQYERKKPQDPWKFKSRTKNNEKFSSVKVPYDDELSFGITQRFWHLEANAKYLIRKGKDEIVLIPAKYAGIAIDPALDSTNAKVYANNGSSHTEVISATIRNLQSFDIANINNTFELSFNHTETKRHGEGYERSLSVDDIEDNSLINVNGKIMKKSEKPLDDFAHPWTLHLATTSHLRPFGLRINNTLTFKSAHKKLLQNGQVMHNGENIPYYETTRLKPSYTWDMRISHETKISGNLRAIANLDINNVLNRRNDASVDTDKIRTYDAGRSFWLEAGVKW